MYFLNLAVSNVYLATEGEGVHIGIPQIFVRFQGCSYRCKNCDSKESWSYTGPTLFDCNDKILLAIENLKIKRVSITGGNPLDLKNRAAVLELIKSLKMRGYFVGIEISGLEIDYDILELVDLINCDYKTPSTGVSGNIEILYALVERYVEKIQIKSIIEDEADFFAVYKVFCELKPSCFWCLTPAYNRDEEFPVDRFKMVLKLNEENGGLFRAIGQQHKWIYGVNETSV